MAGPAGLIFVASSAAIFRIASSLEGAVSCVAGAVGDSPAVGAGGSVAGPTGGVA
jgi:isoaspartyl peptidase/L-asparaginase-like protein (Ntn-hydrolase superfamily)